MRRTFTTFLAVLAVLFSMISTKGGIGNAGTEQKERAQFKGVVHDVNKARITGALVTLEASDRHYAARTNDAGEFQIIVPPAEYFITVNAEGFVPYISRAVRLKGGKTEKLDIELKENKRQLLVPAGPVTPNLSKPD